jgi:hypothetical protein
MDSYTKHQIYVCLCSICIAYTYVVCFLKFGEDTFMFCAVAASSIISIFALCKIHEFVLEEMSKNE